jgi:lipopolysaccharide/colanic/teichoic acid biosynthesis glycosyltransferase
MKYIKDKRFYKFLIPSLIGAILFVVPINQNGNLTIPIAVAIKIEDGGPVFYKSRRLGIGFTEFDMLKFRSMKVNAPDLRNDDGSTYNSPTDRRVTRVGHFLRETSLDELPQFFNVLKGDMSLVGPRPERPLFVEKFREEIPRYMIKHQVRPGITGWAQINGYRGDTSIKKRIECDLYYIENWSVGLDIKILFLTIFRGFINKNAY